MLWFLLFTHAPVAQGIGRQPPELKIAGSSPAGRTIHQSYSVSFKKNLHIARCVASFIIAATQAHLTPQITKPSIVKGRIQQLNCACGLYDIVAPIGLALYSILIFICLGLCSSGLGISISRTPSLKDALMLSGLMAAGSVNAL